MIDTDAIARLVQEQIAKTVKEQVDTVLAADEWLESLEQKILEYTQARILSKFSNASTMPEIIEAVKQSVAQLFAAGDIPGVEQFVDSAMVRAAVDQAVEQIVLASVDQFGQDPAWRAKVERMINQTVVHETLAKFGAIDIGPTIKQRVDETMQQFTKSVLERFTSTGISDQATACQLTVMDDTVVVENCLTASSLDVVNSAQINHLVVTGSINTDNESWQALAAEISQKTLDSLTEEWNKNLIQDVVEHIQEQGIDFEQVLVGGQKLVDGNQLARAVTESSLQTVGTLKTLEVRGETHMNNNTLNVLNKRLGVNTESPEMALSVWDEEVSVVVGKNQANEAYIGTNRDQGVAIGVNRTTQIEISKEGLTRIKQLQVGLHKISHATTVPGWAGTKGDMVFNSNPSVDNNVFAWVCLGAHRWKTIKSIE